MFNKCIFTFYTAVLNFYDTVGDFPFEFFWDVSQDVAPVKC